MEHVAQNLNLWWVLLVPLLPAAAFVVLLPMSRRVRNACRFVPIAAMVVALGLSIAAAVQVYPGSHIGEPFWQVAWQLATLGGHAVTISFAVDSLAVLMLVMVCIVGICVQIFSLFYMKDDDRRGWFFCVMALFLAAMLGFVLSGSLLVEFALWEIMGVCSYLLIGFWYRDEAPRKASQKAFLVTRTGDVGFFVALAAIYAACGSFEFEHIFATVANWSPALLMVSSIGLIWAAIGKSAQIPLSAWLPDAMAGPTPGSALIHAATMVVAGVFMLTRMLPVLTLNPLAMQIILVVGIITALYGAILACFQTDLKKVLAFSTISQLGYMVAAIGVGSATAAVFHLTTHAFFKALLFLTAGIIIHATHTQDMRQMGGLARRMPITTVVWTIGAFSLAGVLPLSGFFSKDEIFTVIWHSGQYWAFAGAAAVGVLTSLYVVKTWFTVFFGNSCNVNAHEGTATELVPVSILAALTLVCGFLTIPLARFLGHEGEWPSLTMAATSTAVMLCGAALGYTIYARQRSTERLKQIFNVVVSAADARFYLDWVYDTFFIRPYFWLSEALWKLDAVIIDGAVNGVAWLYRGLTRLINLLDARIIDGAVNGAAWLYRALTRGAQWFDSTVIDGIVNGLGTLSRAIGAALRRVQTGHLQRYQRLIVGAAVVIVAVLVLVLRFL
ncbi:MAG: NADH-quinone oxidoreductase subunit L [Actinomycetes bacterium]|nr:NADH-quinone oxidoreductase subunit L [Actinomycetes bacterium]